MGNRVRLTNDTLNGYGYRVLTKGVDITQYERNPILLYMHNRGKAIRPYKGHQERERRDYRRVRIRRSDRTFDPVQKQWTSAHYGW